MNERDERDLSPFKQSPTANPTSYPFYFAPHAIFDFSFSNSANLPIPLNNLSIPLTPT